MLRRFLIVIYSITFIMIAPGCNNERPSPFGMLGTFDYGNYEKAADYAQDIGVKWNRLRFDYDSFVDENGEIDLDEIVFSDTIVDLALEHDIEMYACVTIYKATWDDELGSSRNEENFQKYENFLSYLVEHYKGRIVYWEIWNEPEADVFWKPAPNAVIYTQLLKRAYRKAKEANKQAKIIGLSSSLWSVDFIEETFQNDALNYMDILGLHPYCYLDSNYKSIFEISHEYNRIDDIRDLMIEHHGTIKPLWVTEVGFPTYKGEFGVSEQRQAEMLVRSFVMLIVKEVEVIAWYCFINDGFDETDNEDNFGILTNDFNPKKAFSAYKNMTDILEGYTFAKVVTIEEKSKAVLFKNNKNMEILIVWTFDEVPNTEDGNVVVTAKNIQLTIDGEIENIYDIYKNAVELPSLVSPVDIEISSSPIYIIGVFDIINSSQ
jgi:hypothetical protein